MASVPTASARARAAETAAETGATRPEAARSSLLQQPKAVWAVAFACVISFMGIGFVDPILPAIGEQMHASHAEVELLFTSYLLVTALAMLITGWVSSRIGGKRTLILGLVIIVAFAGLAALSPTIGAMVGFRAGWGLGNALFIATSLAVIVGSASGGVPGAIAIYEAAMGIGIAVGPLLGGLLGSIGWQLPFLGVSALMLVGLVGTALLVPSAPTAPRPIGVLEPLKALRHRALLILSLVALLYNWAFFTVLAYAPLVLGLDALALGGVFFGWGLLVAIFAVAVAPRLERRFGLVPVLVGTFAVMALDLAVMAAWTDVPAVLITTVIVSGACSGLNNTLVTQAVMQVAPVERPVASAAYSFVRFLGGGLAPLVAGLVGAAVSIHLPFWLGVAALVAAVVLLLSVGRRVEEAVEASTAEVLPEIAGDSPAEVPVQQR
ncbi:MFS transporter [Agrococcus sp. SL85]|uniref:MFS transporter n=1 Tax=Agrococcus sp. SL85 TaxID=2995141 RepID=UPI00226CADB1|nr:MFS transporter [Agrococcus sp. SL85]WAC67049.1 MFS transporter [Agrococcus sp. SL85]